MLTIRHSKERGHADHGWLNSHHSFSFAGYHDPKFMNFRMLRVINEDRVQGGQGFGTHSHRDFEIISYVISGELKHEDSMGHAAVMKTGEVQRISAGTGISHSEFNNSDIEPVHFLQIWITPSKLGVAPNYAQQSFASALSGQLTLACSGDAREGSILLNQNVDLYIGKLAAGDHIDWSFAPQRHGWIQMIAGDLDVNGTEIMSGDGLAIDEEQTLRVVATCGAHFLLFDLN
ncbi:MAG: pirin family protein [Pseudomonadota bacterium]